MRSPYSGTEATDGDIKPESTEMEETECKFVKWHFEHHPTSNESRNRLTLQMTEFSFLSISYKGQP